MTAQIRRILSVCEVVLDASMAAQVVDEIGSTLPEAIHAMMAGFLLVRLAGN